MANTRYSQKDEGSADSTEIVDGDTVFLGLNTRDNPDSLQQGFYQVGENVRITPNPISIRKGLDKRTNGISFSSAALYVPDVYVGDTLNDFPADGIFAACLFSDPENDEEEALALATQGKIVFFGADTTVTEYAFPSGETIETTDKVDMFQAGGAVYILRGLNAGTKGVSSLTRSSGTATLTTTAAHGLSNGNWIQISGANETQYNGYHQITVTGANTFTYPISGGSTPATGTIICTVLKPALKYYQGAVTMLDVGDTGSGDRIWLPPSNFGVLQANRAIVSYSRTAVAVSDINNVEKYDPINGVLTFANGWSDYLVGGHPYQDNKTLIFLRKSIYLLNNVDGDVAGITNQLLTQQVGCASAGSVATCGADVLFLSDSGVFRLSPGYELSLRGNSEPLSAPISTIIRRINFNAVNQARACYHDNRYYLAVPLDGATRNNAVLVYNFLTQSWESLDTYPTDFRIDFIRQMMVGNSQTMFFVSKEGGVYAAEQNDYDEFAEASSVPSQIPISGRVRTRRITYQNNNIKRFTKLVTNVSLEDESAFSVSVYLTNPDGEKALPSISTETSNNITKPMIVGKRGYGIEIEYQNTAGVGRIINYTMTGIETGFKPVESK